MMGRIETMRSHPRTRDVVRVTSNAKASPSDVQAIAHAVASAIVFQTTPQRAFDTRQAKPHSLSAASRATKAGIETVPSCPWIADNRIFVTGKNVSSLK